MKKDYDVVEAFDFFFTALKEFLIPNGKLRFTIYSFHPVPYNNDIKKISLSALPFSSSADFLAMLSYSTDCQLVFNTVS